MRPILLPLYSTNHSTPSGPTVMFLGLLLAVGIVNSLVTTPAVVIRPILLPLNSVNHSAPSGPAVIAKGALPAVGMVNSLKLPAVVMRPTLLPPPSTNHSAPSGPAAMPCGALEPVGTTNSLVMTPPVVMRPILLPAPSVNHSAPSGPATMLSGKLLAVGIVNSVTTPAVVIWPILLPLASVNHNAPSGPAAMLLGELLAVGMAYWVMLCAVASVGSVTRAKTNAAGLISDQIIFAMNVTLSLRKQLSGNRAAARLSVDARPKGHLSARQTRRFALSAGSKAYRVRYCMGTGPLRQRRCRLVCRFSDAEMSNLSTRLGVRRPKSAKARNRGGWARWRCRGLYGELSGRRARRERREAVGPMASVQGVGVVARLNERTGGLLTRCSALPSSATCSAAG